MTRAHGFFGLFETLEFMAKSELSIDPFLYSSEFILFPLKSKFLLKAEEASVI